MLRISGGFVFSLSVSYPTFHRCKKSGRLPGLINYSELRGWPHTFSVETVVHISVDRGLN